MIVDFLDIFLGPYRLIFRNLRKKSLNQYMNALNIAVAAGTVLHLHLQKSISAELSHLKSQRELTFNLLQIKSEINLITKLSLDLMHDVLCLN